MAIATRTLRTLIVLLSVVAAVLLWAIYLAANSKAHATANELKDHPDAALVERAEKAEAERLRAQKEAEEARKKDSAHIESLQDENTVLKNQVKTATVSLDVQAKKIAVLEEELQKLRQTLEAAQKETAELNAKYAQLNGQYTEAKAELAQELAKDRRAAAAQVVRVPRADANVAHAGGKKKGQGQHKHNYDADSSSPPPSSSAKHDPGVGPRLSEKAGTTAPSDGPGP